MKIKSLVIGYALALALLLFAQHRPGAAQPSGFTGVVDLTHSFNGQASSLAHSNKAGGPLRAATLVRRICPAAPRLRLRPVRPSTPPRT